MRVCVGGALNGHTHHILSLDNGPNSQRFNARLISGFHMKGGGGGGDDVTGVWGPEFTLGHSVFSYTSEGIIILITRKDLEGVQGKSRHEQVNPRH